MSFIPSGECIGKAEYGDPTYDVSQPPITTFTGRWLRSFFPPSWIQKRTFETEVPWYIPLPGDKFTKPAKLFFQDYTGITNDDELINHLCTIRDQAWNLKVSQYPYLGRWWFLRSIFALTPHYESVLEQAREGATILDVACGLGHELRYLKFSGANGKIYAIDVQQEMWDLGLQLFADKNNPPATFIRAEIVFDREENLKSAFPTTVAKPDIILLNRFLDLQWSEYGRFAVQNLVTHCSKPGTRIVGYTLGTEYEKATDVKNRGERGARFLTCDAFVRCMWQDVTGGTGMSWDIDIQVVGLDVLGFEAEDSSWMEHPPTNAICFDVKRTA